VKPPGKVRPIERHAEKEAQGRDRAVDARRLHAALRLVQLEAAQISAIAISGERPMKAANARTFRM